MTTLEKRLQSFIEDEIKRANHDVCAVIDALDFEVTRLEGRASASLALPTSPNSSEHLH